MRECLVHELKGFPCLTLWCVSSSPSHRYSYTQIGQRVFDLQLEATIVADVDVLAHAGGLSKVAVIVAAAAVVNDGSLTIPKRPNAPIPLFRHCTSIDLVRRRHSSRQ
jgi:hypothetical protein